MTSAHNRCRQHFFDLQPTLRLLEKNISNVEAEETAEEINLHNTE